MELIELASTLRTAVLMPSAVTALASATAPITTTLQLPSAAAMVVQLHSPIELEDEA